MLNSFDNRHIGTNASEKEEMFKTIGVNTLDQLIKETVPAGIRLPKELNITQPMVEADYLNHIRDISKKNSVFNTYIGLGYYNTITPSPILRNIFENPAWYTAYTPYQAEISQGRLEALLNYQTMVSDLTAMPIANASLLDEATAAAEAMNMFFNSRNRNQIQQGVNKFFVSENCFPQTIDVVKTRSTPLGIDVVIGDEFNFKFDESFFGVLVQYPNLKGEINDYSQFTENCHTKNIQVCVATDLMALSLITPPGEWGADCVIGNSQRFGVPMGFGGPHAAFFACKEDYKRQMPGRIIGVSVDSQGNPALRMALQTREQHIKRDKATSNICTAQALLAIMASMYAVYHGAEGIKQIADKIHAGAVSLSSQLKKLGYIVNNNLFFDTIVVECNAAAIKTIAEKHKINFNYIDDKTISITVDETLNTANYIKLLTVFSEAKKVKDFDFDTNNWYYFNAIIKSNLKRKSDFLTHPIFNTYHTETKLMRYIKRLESKDLSLVHSMISLGSCTMKLNAASELIPLSWPEFANIHPFVPKEQALGYYEMIEELNKDLAEITGFDTMSFQPNSGAQGEYTGLMVIRAYHESKKDTHRNIALIPSSAHGTNPASAALAGMKIIVVKCDERGNIDITDLKEKAEANKANLSCLMVTYPSTHGVFEEGIKDITKIIHDNGGLVYMDGANMNAQVGLTNPATIGADVCHLNLHKTFAIPHGGGGPGMGPIGVNKKLKPFLPNHSIIKTSGKDGITAVSAAPFGSALILLISYGYIKMLGASGLKLATENAILNANYMKDKLKNDYKILYTGKNGRCAHELILDCSDFKQASGVEVGDIAKRLMDYGFHAPTVSFPVHDTLMIEPTESEDKAELDRFCEAMISIKKEINEIIEGKYSKENNVIKNAPHTSAMIIEASWDYPYSRRKAVFPLKWVQENKFWPAVAKIDNALGDRNLICTCVSTAEYIQETVLEENNA
jgi:glycine dehydrogenase